MQHSSEDAKWIRQQLERIPPRYRQQAMDGYSDAYQSAHDAEPAIHRKENAARFAANTRLRKFIVKVLALTRLESYNTCTPTQNGRSREYGKQRMEQIGLNGNDGERPTKQ